MQVYSYVFTRDRLGRRGMGITPNVKEWLDCEELPLRNSHKQVKSLWVEIKDSSDKGHLAGVYGSLLTRPGFNYGKHCARKLSS